MASYHARTTIMQIRKCLFARPHTCPHACCTCIEHVYSTVFIDFAWVQAYLALLWPFLWQLKTCVFAGLPVYTLKILTCERNALRYESSEARVPAGHCSTDAVTLVTSQYVLFAQYRQRTFSRKLRSYG